MFKKTLTVLLLASILFATGAIAGPFGIEKGMSLKDIGGDPTDRGNGVYVLSRVPKPHSAFESYGVRISPKCGAYWVKAIGKDITTSVYGTGLKIEFTDMESKLEASYGEHKTSDILMPGSIWDDPKDWMFGVIKKERILIATWDTEKGSCLPAGLKSVDMFVCATGPNNGYIAIEYAFTNMDECEAELAGQEDGAL